MAKGHKLTPKQERFVVEYLIDLNATRASIRAGYSAKTASRIGPELLGKTWVAAAISVGKKKRAAKIEITAERVLLEYARLGFSDMKEFATWGGRSVTLKDSAGLKKGMSRAVQEVCETMTKEGPALKIKLHDKKGALDSIAKHLGMFDAKDPEPTNIDGVYDLLVDDDDEVTSADPVAQAPIDGGPAKPA